ncbi:LuxR family transcriptional regulator [Nocardia africana]|uniref:Two component system sensor kinase SsrB n=1 Tax=Nocardia africana TaxID=134964 RepID=A0A378WYD8_9NOCA|nr:LuxR family transcriptional regulator [Nocardia africana]MCC3312344.1 LuxR C-terminal-related transcriptional regulator [Nocardia africana]SUA46346.1 two component system sensor kinase SsrB [Nocardia africana]
MVAWKWPLVGRDAELAFISAAMRDRKRSPPGVVIAGAPGVGKTRLAREALAKAVRSGARERWVVGTKSGRSVPLGALSRHLQEDGAASESGRPAIPAARALAAPIDGRRVVVGVDDAHLLDDQSAMAVHQLVLTGTTPVVMTVGATDSAPDAITSLWKDGYLERLDLRPLSLREVTALLETALGGELERSSAERLWRLAGGTVLFLRLLVTAEREAGRLRLESGVWRWFGDDMGLPTTLTSLIEAQMGALDPLVREVVDILAIEEPLTVRALEELAGRRAIEQAEERGLVTVQLRDEQGMSVRLAHPLYGEVRRDRTGTLHAIRLRGRIARALTRPPCTSAARLRAAVLTMQSDLPPEPRLFMDGARIALGRGDAKLCAQLAGAAANAGSGLPARWLRAHALAMNGDGTQAEHELAALADVGDDAQRARVAIDRVTNMFWSLGRVGDAERIQAQARSSITDRDAQQSLIALGAVLDLCRAHPRVAARTAQGVLDSGCADPVAVAPACYALVGALGVLGKTDRIGPFADRGATAARSHETSILPIAVHMEHVHALVNAGYLHRAQALAADVRAMAADAPAPIRTAAMFVDGRVALRCGRLAEALRALREATSGLGGRDAFGMRYACRVALAQALAFTGDAEKAAEAMAAAEAARHPGFAFLDPDLIRVRAWVVATGQRASAEAIAIAHEAADLAAKNAQLSLEVLALHTAVQFGDVSCAERLSRLASSVDGPRAPAAAHQAAALTDRDGAALDEVAAEFEGFGDLLAAADCAAQAASAHAYRGMRVSALASAARARRIATECGAHTPAIQAITAIDARLTERQREIATLIGQGLTNQQIADRLIVSVRTVEGHIYRAGRQLGVNTREALAAIVCGR